MPVFERYHIDRYKEVLTNQPSGLVSDGGFSTYSLDDPNITPNGTGDFLGVIKTIVLLAEVYKETIDTRNMSFSQFNNLSQQEFDDYVRQGIILLNRKNNGVAERIGWVEIARSHASFYYQSCPTGKRPVSEHYFDIQEFAFNNRTVIGEGSEIEPTEALTPIGNFDPNIVNNLGVLRPRFEPLNLTDYVRFAMDNYITNSDGETVRIGKLGLSTQTRPNSVSLLMANKSEHFDNEFTAEISSGKWGTIRRTITESLKPGTYVIYPPIGAGAEQNTYTLDFSINTGECLETQNIPNYDGGIIVVDVQDDMTTPISTYELENTQFIINDTIIDGIPPKITGVSDIYKSDKIEIPVPDGSDESYNGENQARVLYKIRGSLDGWLDPRELLNDTLNLPAGNVYAYRNFKKNEIEIRPSILKEPILTSRKQKVGASRSSLGNIYRRHISKMYSLNGSNKSYIIPKNDTLNSKNPYKYSENKYIFEKEQLIYSVGVNEFGTPQFTDSESFRERCIFTGYYATFQNSFSVTIPQLEKGSLSEKIFWKKIIDNSKNQSITVGVGKNAYSKKEPNISETFIDENEKIQPRKFPIVYKSKSLKYSMSSLPTSTIFMGYFENYALNIDDIRSASGKNQLEIFKSNLTPMIDSDVIGAGAYDPKRTGITRLYRKNSPYRDMIVNNVYKNDIILKETIVDSESSYVKRKIKSPKLSRRSELYAPNPFKHLLYSDFIGWSLYLTDYTINNVLNTNLRIGSECRNRLMVYGGRSVDLNQRFEIPSFVTNIVDPTSYWIEIRDKTHIMDVYFGLMEMHIKGYPWSIIFDVMDKLPSGLNTDNLNRFFVGEKTGICTSDKKLSNFIADQKIQFDKISTGFEDAWYYMISNGFVQIETLPASSGPLGGGVENQGRPS